MFCCVQWFKDTKLKANHNTAVPWRSYVAVVSNGSKILNWKQITTIFRSEKELRGCVQWFKDTKLKANHNYTSVAFSCVFVVSNGSKILNWKQITTTAAGFPMLTSCVQWFKDTKLKANHNIGNVISWLLLVVSNGSKILNWKQITTQELSRRVPSRLCPMVQRY